MKFIIQSLLLANCFYASNLYSQPRLSPWLEVVQPIEIAVLKDGRLGLSYLKPCGAKFVGVAARQAGTKPMLVGALLQRQPTMCISMPILETVTVGHLSAAAYDPMPGFRPHRTTGSRLRLTEIVSLQRVNESGRGVLQAVFEPRCGEVVASIFNDDAKGLLKVGILEEITPAKTCAPMQMARALRFVNLPESIELLPIDMKKRSVARDYDLRLREVEIHQVHYNGSSVQLPFERRCNEAPLGAVLQQTTSPGKNGGKLMRVGVLVANFYNQSCDKAAANVKDVWHQTGLRINHNTVFASLPGTNRIGMLTLRSPVSLEAAGKDGRLQMTFLASCERRIGTVYGRDAAGRPTAAVLMRRQQELCEKPARRVEILQPISFADLSQHGKIYPMRLEGFRYFM